MTLAASPGINRMDKGAEWRAVVQVMGLPVSVALRGRHAHDVAARAAWASLTAELREVDAVFSTYRADSAISRLDRGEVTLDDCPGEVRAVVALGERARVESGGAFDIRRPGPDGRLHLDPSGVVKGWAVQRASRHLAELADTDYCLNAGGDMVCHAGDDSPAWQIGIEDPHDPTRLVGRVPIQQGAIATSSAAHRGHHITDARDGSTSVDVAAVTVIAEDLTWADIDATAAFARGRDALNWLTGRRGRSGLVVHDTGRIDTFDRR